MFILMIVRSSPAAAFLVVALFSLCCFQMVVRFASRIAFILSVRCWRLFGRVSLVIARSFLFVSMVLVACPFFVCIARSVVWLYCFTLIFTFSS